MVNLLLLILYASVVEAGMQGLMDALPKHGLISFKNPSISYFFDSSYLWSVIDRTQSANRMEVLKECPCAGIVIIVKQVGHSCH